MNTLKSIVRVPGQGRIYKRGGIWYIDYGVDGQRKRERASRDKGEALRILAAKRTDVERGALGFEKKQTLHFSDFAEEYKAIKAEARSARSIKGYVKHLAAFFGEMPLNRITSEMVEAYKQKRLKQRIRGGSGSRTVKGSSINRDLATLKNMFSVALKQKRFRGDNPVKAVAFFPEQTRDYVLSKEEIGRLLAAAGEPLRQTILIALNTGLRKGEILSLKWNQVSFEDGIISFARTKSAKFHRIPMNEVVRGVLGAVERKGDFVFPGRWAKGHLVDCKKAFEEARRKAELSELHFHDLRHCAGTYMSAAGVPLRTIQQILGHQDVRTTTRYINPNDENRRRAVDVLGALFPGGKEAADGLGSGGTEVAQGKKQAAPTIELSAN